MNIIETDRLTRSFGRSRAVNELTFHVPQGAVYAFLGPNGAGKTTTILTLLNIIRPSSGVARVLGVETTKFGPAQYAQLGYVSENQKLPPGMTVQQYLAWCRPMYPTWDDKFCESIRCRFDLPLNRKLSNLSRGMKMKAALLGSISYRPKLLILDEPFSGLDPLMRDEFIRGVLELSESEKWTVFISSHDIDEVERLANWVGILNMGKLHLSEGSESLQKRFRYVEFVVPEVLPRLPSILPKSWLVPETAGHTVRFVASEYTEGGLDAKIKELFPEGGPLVVRAMSLREIFLALARSFRVAQNT